MLAGGFSLLMLLRMFGPVDRVQLRAQAEAAEQAKDWATALRLWRRINDTPGATGMTHLGVPSTSAASRPPPFAGPPERATDG